MTAHSLVDAAGRAPGRPRVRVRLMVAIAAVLALLGVGVATAVDASAASPDYTQGVTALNAAQAKVWLRPTTPAGLVDVHYLVSGVPQQDFRMANNGGTWERTVSGLSTGTAIEDWVTYEKSGPLYDTEHYHYSHGAGGGGTTTEAPTFNPPPGDYQSAQTVTLSSATPGATIRYTTNGSTPTTASTRYTGPINVPSSRTIKAIAVASGKKNSPISTAVYTITTGGGGGGT